VLSVLLLMSPEVKILAIQVAFAAAGLHFRCWDLAGGECELG